MRTHSTTRLATFTRCFPSYQSRNVGCRAVPATQRAIPLVLASLLSALPLRGQGTDTTAVRRDVELLVGTDTEPAALLDLYRTLHANPELSFHERKTSARLATALKEVGCEVTSGIGGFGLVGILENGDGPTTMLRADMDALPLAEATGLDYTSKIHAESAEGLPVGIMHACGHDVHMTCLVGAATWLAAHRDAWQGTAMFVMQPAEERGGGARAMLNDGLFERFAKPDQAIALHVSADLPAGTLGYRAGATMAAVDSVDIVLHGRGGHGAAPHTTIDPVVMGARLVLDLQTIVARELRPTDSAVITVGAFTAGTKHNIIGDQAHLQLTVRSYSPEVRKHLLAAIERKALATTQSAGAPAPDIEVSESLPPLINDADLTARVLAAFKDRFPPAEIVPIDPEMIAEDFAFYGEAGVPICMFRLGSQKPSILQKHRESGEPIPSLHSSGYYPDAVPTLTRGVEALVASVLWLNP